MERWSIGIADFGIDQKAGRDPVFQHFSTQFLQSVPNEQKGQ
jgi:hypothetical protein